MKQDRLNNLHLIQVKYIGASNTKGAKISIYSHKFKERRYFRYSYEYGNILEQAIFILNEYFGFKVEAYSEMNKGYAILTSTFEPLKK